MKCGFCGYEYDENEGENGCGNCPGGCHSVHCPRCNYKNPLEPSLIKSVRKLFSMKENNSKKGE
jgi:rubredoxin